MKFPLGPLVAFILLYSSSSFSGIAQHKVIIKTEAGNITLELYEKQAPLTTANFLRYVDEKRYDGATFYRALTPDNQPKDSIKIQILQGGLAPQIAQAFPPIAHESTQQTGILHQDGVISMVRQAPGTARSEFFICIGAQSALDTGGKRNPDGQGFAAFGKVVTGMEVVRKIHQSPLQGPLLIPPIKILAITRIKGS